MRSPRGGSFAGLRSCLYTQQVCSISATAVGHGVASIVTMTSGQPVLESIRVVVIAPVVHQCVGRILREPERATPFHVAADMIRGPCSLRAFTETFPYRSRYYLTLVSLSNEEIGLASRFCDRRAEGIGARRIARADPSAVQVRGLPEVDEDSTGRQVAPESHTGPWGAR